MSSPKAKRAKANVKVEAAVENDVEEVDANAYDIFNALEQFSFFLTMEEWLLLKPLDNEHYSDGRRGLREGWTDMFEIKLHEVNPCCMRIYTGTAKKVCSRKQSAPFFTARVECKNPGCTLELKLVIEKEPTAETTEVEVNVFPSGNFVPADPIEVQNRFFRKMKNKMSRRSHPAEEKFISSPLINDFADFPDDQNPRRFPPFALYGKNTGGSVFSGCGSGKTMEDLLYCSTLEADKAKLMSEKEKYEAEATMLRAKADALIAKKIKFETETNNLIMHRLKLKHELNAIGLDVEIVDVGDDEQLREVLKTKSNETT